jgi:hypothetical protein
MVTDNDLKRRYEAQEAEKRQDGRYTLEEAAATWEQHTGERAAPFLEKLTEAVRDGAVPVCEPGKHARYYPLVVRGYYDEVYWDDLNAWLAKNEKRIRWQFCRPAQATKQADAGLTDDAETVNDGDPKADDADDAIDGASARPKATSKLPPGIPTGEIANAFRLTSGWVEKLKHVARNPFLKPALMRQGSRKKGKTPAAPHLWNPVTIAWLLILRDGRNARAMEATITHHFPAWQDAWAEHLQDDDTDCLLADE